MITGKECLIDRLIALGLLEMQAKIYLLLLIQGPKSATDIAKTLLVNRQRLYRILGSLSKLSIIKKSNVNSVVYSAIPIDQIFLKSLKANEDKLNLLEKKKQMILPIWRGFTESEDPS